MHCVNLTSEKVDKKDVVARKLKAKESLRQTKCGESCMH
jgi:hypothetical protein